MKPRPILPGATLGLFGGGQLGRMFALAARRLGYRVHLFAPEDACPADGVVDKHIACAYADESRVADFARSVDVVTYEFENVPADAVAVAQRHAPVRPGPQVLADTQHRGREKNALLTRGFPVVPFRTVASPGELADALACLGKPVVLKTLTWGYDGKGQFLLEHEDQIATAWAAVGGHPCTCEAWIEFEREVSVVVARDALGATVVYGPIENAHANHILDVSVFPARVQPRVADEARRVATAVAEAMDTVGVICVEFFQLPDGELLVNEIAPRPHNSGHLTIEGYRCSQFEQQVRAICGLPLGSTEARGPAAMANLLGDLWQSGEPRWEAVLALGDVALHLYGKTEARVGRKMGHLTALADTPEDAERKVRAARSALEQSPASDTAQAGPF
jgi:5-(carboxyamino)imidazole ribonucleotide synthase